MHIINCLGGKYFGNKLSRALGVEAIFPDLYSFGNGELLVSLPPSGLIKGSKGASQDPRIKSEGGKVYIVQSFELDANNRLIELLLCIDAARRAGASEIHVIIPYLCYSRQGKPLEPYAAFGMKVVANLLSNSGIAGLIIVDIHAPSSLELFTAPAVNIGTRGIFGEYIKDDQRLIVMPDKGSLERWNGSHLQNEVVYFDKNREGEDLYMKLFGDVEGKRCIIIDDIIDTGRTISMATEILMASGAKSVDACATHALLTPKLKKLIAASPIRNLLISSSIENIGSLPKNIRVIDIAQIVASLLA